MTARVGRRAPAAVLAGVVAVVTLLVTTTTTALVTAAPEPAEPTSRTVSWSRGVPAPRTDPSPRTGEELTVSILRQDFAVTAPGELRLDLELFGELPPRPLPPEPPPGPDDGSGTGDQDDEHTDTESDTDADTATDGAVDPDDTVEVVPWLTVIVSVHEPLERRDQVLPAAAGVVGATTSRVEFDVSDRLPDDADLPGLVVTDLADLRVPIVDGTDTDTDTDADTGAGADEATGADTPGDEHGDGAERVGLAMPDPGLYPVTVDLVHEGRRLARRITFVERLPGPDGRTTRTRPYRLAVLATVDDPGPEPSPLQLVQARAGVLELVQLAEALDAPLTALVPPGVLRAVGEDAELGRRLADALDGDEFVAVPDLTLDPSSAVGADVQDAFVRELRRGEDVIAEIAPNAATQRTAWISTSAPSVEGAAMLRDLGARLLVLPLGTYHRLPNSLHPSFTDPSTLYRADVGDDGWVNVAVVDPVSRWLDPRRADGRTPAEAAAITLAELSATRLQLRDANRIAVLSPPGFGIPDGDVLAHVDDMVRAHPAFELRTLHTAASTTDTLTFGPGSDPLVLPFAAGPDLRLRALALAETSARAETIATMLPDGDDRPVRWGRDLDRWISTGYRDDEIATRLDALDAELVAIPASIEPPEPFTFTLTGSESDVTLRITNDFDSTLRVLVHAEASKLTFPEGDVLVDLLPGTNTVDLPVRTLSNGTFDVVVEMWTPDGSTRLGEVVLTARVNALTGIGQVLTGGLVLVLVTWWISHLRGNRRRSRAAAAERHPCTSGSVGSP